MRLSKGKGAAFIVMLLLVLDQALKIWIKTHFQLHESVEITPWFYIYFTENPGMAFGIEVNGGYGIANVVMSNSSLAVDGVITVGAGSSVAMDYTSSMKFF